MNHEDSKENARTRILTCAAIIFAENGYDGAKVDKIAQMAQVPKSLIYYHFSSKKEIYDILTQELIDSYKLLITSQTNDENYHTPTQLKERMQRIYYQFGIDHEAIVRTVLMDSFKKGNTNTILFRMVSMLAQSSENLTLTEKDHLLNEFFFNILPCMAYVCLKDSWTQFFDLKENDFDQSFLNAYSNTHGHYHEQKGGNHNVSTDHNN